MYDLHDYARMIADEARMGPYIRALEAVVQPGSVVADIGTGTGILALVACRLGARRVYAIDTSDVIEVGRALARENGAADRIVFFHNDVRDVELPERADVIVSDLRGALPLYGDHLSIIADVRARFLKGGGRLVPEQDRLMAALVEEPDLYNQSVGPARGPLGITLESMRERLVHATYVRSGTSVLPSDCIVSDAVSWAVLEYATAKSIPISGLAELRVNRASTVHGVMLWFETLLAGGHGFSTAPGRLHCYGQLFLPWPRPVVLAEGDVVTVDLWAQADGDPWGWNSSVPAGPGARESFKQSSFLSVQSKPAARMRRSGVPTLSQVSRS
jgi:type I protein arginine methyltransferase